jgi:molecular chaperone GrpE
MNQTRRSEDQATPEAVESPGAEDAAPAGASQQTGAEAAEQGAPPSGGEPAEVELAAELEATRERLLRALAETENLRRRAAREVEEAHKYAITGFARELLEVADNLSRALSSIPPRARGEIDFVRHLADGVAMTEKALLASFERHQIAKVEPALGSRFDHNLQQAMLEIETADYPPGTVAQVMQPGYVIADRLLRPALVGVARAPRAGAGAAGEAGGAGPPRPGERVDTTA